MSEPYEWGLLEAARAIRDGEIEAADFARSLIDRHESVESDVRALAHFDGERLLDAARELDARKKTVERVGALAGLPLGIKDIYDCAGWPTRAGIRGGDPWHPETTAPSVQPFLDADALVYGKTATTGRAYLDPASTCNPWNLSHTPGGSSSGSAAGVAARMFPAALGSQTAGSVIRPAAYCGVVGMTLTRGRVPMERGVVPLVPRFDTPGIFVRSVEDAEFLVSVWCGDDGHGPLLEEIPQESFERPVFVGFARRYFAEMTDDEAAHQALHASRKLSDGGAIVHVLKLPESLDSAMAHHRNIFAYEASQVHRIDYQRNPSGLGPKIAALVEEGLRVDRSQYHRALELLDHFREDMLVRVAEVDAIVLPAATGAAPLGLDSTGDPGCNAPWTAIGFPCLTIPSGLTRAGLPLGLQLVGRPMGESNLLRVARFCESVIGFGCPSPPIRD